MPVTCPAGHVSESTDYCDTCGAAIAAVPAAPVLTTNEPPPPGLGPESGSISPCPNCGSPAGVNDAFCEVCGIDFATGEMPTKQLPAVGAGGPPSAAATATAAGATTPATPATAEAGTAPPPEGWVAVVEADRAFYEGNESPEVPLPFPEGRPAVEVPLRSNEVLIGRRSDSRGVFPDVDLGPPSEDPGVSRRHAVLRHKADGSWVVIDQGSTNGTRVSGGTGPLKPGDEQPVLNGDQLLLGAWTRITLKRA